MSDTSESIKTIPRKMDASTTSNNDNDVISGPIRIPAKKNGGLHTNEELLIKTIVMDDVRRSAKKLKTGFMGQMELRLNQMMDDIVNSMEHTDVLLQHKSMSSISSSNSGHMKDKRKTKEGLPEKEFRSRDSPLTELLQIEHFKTIHHIFVSTLALFMIHTLIMDLLTTGSVDLGFGNFRWAFGDLEIPLTLFAGMHFVAIVVVYPLFYLWATQRLHLKPDERRIVDLTSLMGFTIFMAMFMYIPAVILWRNPLAPASGCAVTIEQCRLLMKIYAFVRSNVPRALKFQNNEDLASKSILDFNNKSISDDIRLSELPSNEEYLRKRMNLAGGSISTSSSVQAIVNQSEKKKMLTKKDSLWISFSWNDEDSPCPDYSKYLYYLFAPTLIYRDFYPRTNRVRWNFVCSNFGQCIGCIIYANFIVSRYCTSTSISRYGLQPINLTQLLQAIFHLMLPGILCLILGFFLLLHAWQNAFAEMLCFGDRLFYKDWWNSSSFASYYKTWNVLVHDWLYTYVFKDAWEHGFGHKWKFLPTTLVFIISSIFHEYILSFTFNFFFPVLLTLFGGVGFAFVFIKNGKNALGNIAMWMSLISGTGIIFTFYGIEFFARRNCPVTDISAWDFFKPRALSCDALVYSFS